jgi:nucleotide-binding universal stress UspA family protein
MPAARPVVVGVDGSSGSHRALEWGLREALVRETGVRVVTVWAWDGELGSPVPLQRVGDLEGRARQLQQTLLTRVLAEFGRPVPSVQAEVVQGDAASRLVEQSHDAALLVLGSRGHGRHRHARIGSVAGVCMRHAACPVVVVPAVERRSLDRHPALTERHPLPTGRVVGL